MENAIAKTLLETVQTIWEKSNARMLLSIFPCLQNWFFRRRVSKLSSPAEWPHSSAGATIQGCKNVQETLKEVFKSNNMSGSIKVLWGPVGSSKTTFIVDELRKHCQSCVALYVDAQRFKEQAFGTCAIEWFYLHELGLARVHQNSPCLWERYLSTNKGISSAAQLPVIIVIDHFDQLISCSNSTRVQDIHSTQDLLRLLEKELNSSGQGLKIILVAEQEPTYIWLRDMNVPVVHFLGQGFPMKICKWESGEAEEFINNMCGVQESFKEERMGLINNSGGSVYNYRTLKYVLDSSHSIEECSEQILRMEIMWKKIESVILGGSYAEIVDSVSRNVQAI